MSPAPRPLPETFLDALAGQTEVLVTSREPDGTRGTVRTWFLIASGAVYLFTEAFSTKAHRWRVDRWVRLRVPGTQIAVEGVVHFVEEGPELEAIGPKVVERWGMQGATTLEGLRRVIRERMFVLARVESQHGNGQDTAQPKPARGPSPASPTGKVPPLGLR